MKAKRLKAALNGRSMWLKLVKKYDIDNGVYVLLMPENDIELNEQAMKHIDDLVAHRKARGIVILTNQNQIIERKTDKTNNIIQILPVTETEIDNLLSFCELYYFSKRLLIVSLTKPFGRKLYNIKNVHGVTVEDIVCLCIFMMRDWTVFEGEDG